MENKLVKINTSFYLNQEENINQNNNSNQKLMTLKNSIATYTTRTNDFFNYSIGNGIGKKIKKFIGLKENNKIDFYLYGTPSESGNVALADGDGYVLYNGAVLPKLPEWDKDAYPYVVIQEVKVATNQYRLNVSSKPPYARHSIYGDAHIYFAAPADAEGRHWNLRDGAWGDTNYTVSILGHNDTVSPIIWANYEVKYEDGNSTYLSGSAPIPLTSNERMAAVYGGKKLPVLPEWDKGAYPYAAIAIGLGYYSLDLWSVQPVVDIDPDTTPSGYGPNGETTTLTYCECYPSYMDNWGEFGTMNYTYPTRKVPFWTNTDLYTTDGELWLAKSDPIPIYESTEPINKNLITDFYFSSPENFILSTANLTKNWNGTLYYSSDNLTWNEWDGITTITSGYVDNEYRIYLRGINNTCITGDSSDKNWILEGNNISCNGNIENILDYTLVANNEHPTMDTHCFYKLFHSQTSLTNISETLLSSLDLADYCYAYMFFGCTGLTFTPKNLLPATKLADYCYAYMFEDCTGLISISENLLPAKFLTKYCYYKMFSDCTNLETIPEDLLPATVLADYCYYYMFYGCTNLKNTPASLPSMKLAKYCYYKMFYNCTSLTTIPENFLPAKKLAIECYYCMFYNCTSLTTIPENLLPATELASNCYYSMFYGCSNLLNTPINLPAKKLAPYCYEYMFYGCTSLTTIPENLFSATELANYCYAYMFQNCTGITTIPENLLPITTLAPYCYAYMFQNCTGITSIPENLLPATRLTNYCYYYMFYGCSNITEIPKNLLPATIMFPYCYGGMFYKCIGITEIPKEIFVATNLETGCYYYMFSGCGITTIPEGILNILNLKEKCYQNMFSGCVNLTTIPENLLPATILAPYCYYSMFSGCSSLNNIPKNLLHSTKLAPYCYYQMFYNCTSLENAPSLPASYLPRYTYYQMFMNCTNLKQLPKLTTVTPFDYCYYQMFKGCTNIQLSTSKTGSYQISFKMPYGTSTTGYARLKTLTDMFLDTGGTFVGTPNMNTTYYTTNTLV